MKCHLSNNFVFNLYLQCVVTIFLNQLFIFTNVDSRNLAQNCLGNFQKRDNTKHWLHQISFHDHIFKIRIKDELTKLKKIIIIKCLN